MQRRSGASAGDPVRAARLRSQLLAGPPAGSTLGVVERLLAVQAQDPRGARLAIRSRSAGLTAADVDHALTADRSVVVGWLNRGTLHLVRAEDYWWLHALTTPPLAAGAARRLAQEGVTPDEADRAVNLIEGWLGDDGPLTRSQLRERIDARGIRTRGQALVHLLFLAALRGVSLRGPMVGREQAHVLARDWIGPPGALNRDRALRELARRYLAGHGPASDRDLAKWSGLPLRDARRALSLIADRLAERDDGLASLPAGEPDAATAQPRMLGAFDPLLLGWESRDPVLGRHASKVVAGGMFRPFALVGGRAAGVWAIKGGRARLTPFGPIAPPDVAALGADAEDVERFLGLRD